MNVENQVVKVVVGILKRFNPELNTIEYLFNQRPISTTENKKPYEGYWEFAGGKIEENETNIQALSRELKEELGIEIDVNNTDYLTTTTYDYAHANVELHFYTINSWQGKPCGIEGQNLLWCSKDKHPMPVLPSLEYLFMML
jgi:8-oxo-dGTP diphosphatase